MFSPGSEADHGFDLRVETRYDTIDRGRVKDRLQGAVRLGFRADLVAFVATGRKLTSGWSVEAILAERPTSFDAESAGLSGDGLYTRLKVVLQWRVR